MKWFNKQEMFDKYIGRIKYSFEWVVIERDTLCL